MPSEDDSNMLVAHICRLEAHKMVDDVKKLQFQRESNQVRER